MQDIRFTKISATGNDFIIIDNREGRFHAQRDRQFFSRICQRRRSVGADGVILIEQSSIGDLKYVHINADGSIAEMCGNGSRALAYYAYRHDISGHDLTFEISGHVYRAKITDHLVITDFIPPGKPQLKLDIINEPEIEEGGFIDTGVPHFVVFVVDVGKIDVAELGKKYRHHQRFPKGTNVDFVEVLAQDALNVRTYERGVEAETLACGTGAVACGIISNLRKKTRPPVTIHYAGGVLEVNFDKHYRHLTLAGTVDPVYDGKLILTT